MRKVSLEFANQKHVQELFQNLEFTNYVIYLNPVITTPNVVTVTDPVEHHARWESEAVVLEAFARGFRRVILGETEYSIEFISSFANESKVGLKHNGTTLISNTIVEL